MSSAELPFRLRQFASELDGAAKRNDTRFPDPYAELMREAASALETEQSFDAKQVGDELHDILADSLLSCNCDDSGKCTACRIDDLAHRLSPFGPDVIAAGLEAESATVQAFYPFSDEFIKRFRAALHVRASNLFWKREKDEQIIREALQDSWNG